jgi:hypothetical protein
MQAHQLRADGVYECVRCRVLFDESRRRGGAAPPPPAAGPRVQRTSSGPIVDLAKNLAAIIFLLMLGTCGYVCYKTAQTDTAESP